MSIVIRENEQLKESLMIEEGKKEIVAT